VSYILDGDQRAAVQAYGGSCSSTVEICGACGRTVTRVFRVPEGWNPEEHVHECPEDC